MWTGHKTSLNRARFRNRPWSKSFPCLAESWFEIGTMNCTSLSFFPADLFGCSLCRLDNSNEGEVPVEADCSPNCRQWPSPGYEQSPTVDQEIIPVENWSILPWTRGRVQSSFPFLYSKPLGRNNLSEPAKPLLTTFCSVCTTRLSDELTWSPFDRGGRERRFVTCPIIIRWFTMIKIELAWQWS